MEIIYSVLCSADSKTWHLYAFPVYNVVHERAVAPPDIFCLEAGSDESLKYRRFCDIAQAVYYFKKIYLLEYLNVL